ncbi:MAG: hypothetical protein KDD53_02280 [Bdellovibrionales bacterium]|nr:hypothetical protein [Bdellovibrionales bacterium]
MVPAKASIDLPERSFTLAVITASDFDSSGIDFVVERASNILARDLNISLVLQAIYKSDAVSELESKSYSTWSNLVQDWSARVGAETDKSLNSHQIVYVMIPGDLDLVDRLFGATAGMAKVGSIQRRGLAAGIISRNRELSARLMAHEVTHVLGVSHEVGDCKALYSLEKNNRLSAATRMQVNQFLFSHNL